MLRHKNKRKMEFVWISYWIKIQASNRNNRTKRMRLQLNMEIQISKSSKTIKTPNATTETKSIIYNTRLKDNQKRFGTISLGQGSRLGGLLIKHGHTTPPASAHHHLASCERGRASHWLWFWILLARPRAPLPLLQRFSVTPPHGWIENPSAVILRVR